MIELHNGNGTPQFTGIRAPMVFLWLPMKRYLPFFIVGFVALATFGGAFALYRAKRLAPAVGP